MGWSAYLLAGPDVERSAGPGEQVPRMLHLILCPESAGEGGGWRARSLARAAGLQAVRERFTMQPQAPLASVVFQGEDLLLEPGAGAGPVHIPAQALVTAPGYAVQLFALAECVQLHCVPLPIGREVEAGQDLGAVLRQARAVGGYLAPGGGPVAVRMQQAAMPVIDGWYDALAELDQAQGAWTLLAGAVSFPGPAT